MLIFGSRGSLTCRLFFVVVFLPLLKIVLTTLLIESIHYTNEIRIMAQIVMILINYLALSAKNDSLSVSTEWLVPGRVPP